MGLIVSLLTLILFTGVVVAYVKFRARAKGAIRVTGRSCVACGSENIEHQREIATIRCRDCGYLGRRDQGGKIDFSEIDELHGKPLERGIELLKDD
jgi:ribosomal protein S27E